MDILFATKKLSKVLSSSKDLQKSYGVEGATKVMLRLQQLAAAETLEDMRKLPGKCHELTGDRAGQLAVHVHEPYRIVFEPPDPRPEKPDGGLVWSAVETVTIVEIVDYH